MTIPSAPRLSIPPLLPIVGWPWSARCTAWFNAWLEAAAKGDARVLALATRELHALGVHVAPVAGSGA